MSGGWGKRFNLYGQMLTIFLLLTVLPARAGSGGETPTIPASGAEKQAEYVVGLGDELKILVWKEAELTQAMAVRGDGRISLPLIGEVEAAGKTISDLRKNIEEKYGALISEPAVSVMLVQSKSLRYYVIGKVVRAGEFPIDFPITVLQAIAKSGGFGEWAKIEKISIVRREGGQESIVPFNYEALVNGHNLEQNVLVKPGDTIIVP